MQDNLWLWLMAGGAVLLLAIVVVFLWSLRPRGQMPEERSGPPVEVVRPKKIDESLESFEPAAPALDAQRSITLQFNVKEGDTFNYESTFSGGKKHHFSERIVKVTDVTVQIIISDAPDFIMVLDRRGFPVDFLELPSGRSTDELGDMGDISNQLIFPERPIRVGDTWEADDGNVRVAYRLIRTGTLCGREVAEIHSSTSGYNGPIKIWVELATGMLMRQQYKVNTTRTVTVRL